MLTSYELCTTIESLSKRSQQTLSGSLLCFALCFLTISAFLWKFLSLCWNSCVKVYSSERCVEDNMVHTLCH